DGQGRDYDDDHPDDGTSSHWLSPRDAGDGGTPALNRTAQEARRADPGAGAPGVRSINEMGPPVAQRNRLVAGFTGRRRPRICNNCFPSKIQSWYLWRVGRTNRPGPMPGGHGVGGPVGAWVSVPVEVGGRPDPAIVPFPAFEGSVRHHASTPWSVHSHLMAPDESDNTRKIRYIRGSVLGQYH